MNIECIASDLGLSSDDFELFGRFKAKVDPKILNKRPPSKDSKLVLVTAINPTPAGEGKTTITIAIGDGLNHIGKKAVIALREPSLGPTFGKKGCATGGGYSQVIPMDDINLHFTGDIHAVTVANNLLAALIDNHIFHSNKLQINPEAITWRHCLDVNDRQLRYIISGSKGKTSGVPRKDGFDITAASEIMAVLCLSSTRIELKQRLARIIIGYNFDGEPISVADLRAQGAIASLLKEAFHPNLVQTIEHSPVLMHGGPFANIAHGCSSIVATKIGLALSEYTITEAGFGADLGAEKFLDIKCRQHDIWPNAAVIVVTTRALKLHGQSKNDDLSKPDIDALKYGLPNLTRHIQNMTGEFNIPVVVAINAFENDSYEEIDCIKQHCQSLGIEGVSTNAWELGAKGAVDLAHAIVDVCDSTLPRNNFLYESAKPITEKIFAIAKRIYKATNVEFDMSALKDIAMIEAQGYGHLPVCIAKTPMSFSDKAELKGAPENFTIRVRKAKLSAGAGFVVIYTGSILTMPGLPAISASENIDIDEDGVIHGLA